MDVIYTTSIKKGAMHIKQIRARTQQICELTCTVLETFQAVARAMNGENEMLPAWLFSFAVSRGGDSYLYSYKE